MTATENTAPSAREIRNAVRDLSPTQVRLIIAVETEGRAERSSRPTRDALIRKGIVERSVTGALVLTALGECVAAVLAPAPPVADEPSAEDVLGACVVDEPSADLPEAAEIGTAAHALLETAMAADAGFGYGLTPTELPGAAEIVGYLADAGMSAGIDEHHSVVAYTTNPANLAGALDGTGWAASALTLGGLTVPGMYAVERTFALPPVSAPPACRACGATSGSGCAVCRPDSALGG